MSKPSLGSEQASASHPGTMFQPQLQQPQSQSHFDEIEMEAEEDVFVTAVPKVKKMKGFFQCFGKKFKRVVLRKKPSTNTTVTTTAAANVASSVIANTTNTSPLLPLSIIEAKGENEIGCNSSNSNSSNRRSHQHQTIRTMIASGFQVASLTAIPSSSIVHTAEPGTGVGAGTEVDMEPRMRVRTIYPRGTNLRGRHGGFIVDNTMHGQRSQVEQPQQEQEHKQKQLEQAQEQQKQQQQQQKEDDDKEKQHQEDENEQKLQKQRQQQRLQGKQKHLSVPMLPIIPGRSSSLHAYSTNDAHGTKSGIELASWNESPQSLYNSPLLIENIGDDSSHNGDDNGDDTISTNANPATSLTADSAARHYNSPGMIAKRLRTRTTTIVKTTSDPVITIKLIHTPSDQSISSLVSGYSTSGSNSGGESCGEIEEMINTAVALESHYDRFCHYDRFYGLDYSGLFADFDSVSPRIDEEDEDEVDDDKEDDGRHGDDRGTDDEDYDGDEGQEDGDEDENHTSGSNSRNYRSHTMEDFGFGRLPSPSSSNNHRSNTTAAPHTRGLLPQRHITNAAASVVSADASTFGSSTFTRPSTITFGKDARPMKFATTPKLSRYNRNQSSSSFSKELEHENESVGWIDHFLALNSTYRDHLATLNLQLCRALHYHLLQHTRGLIDLQKHILGVSGIGNEKLTSSFLADMVFEKLRPRMEKDLRDQSQVCWAIGELIQQGLGQTLLTLDYEEEDAFEGVRKRIRTQRSKDEGVLVVDDESEEDMDSDDGDGDDEENGENFGLPRWMKTVRKELQEAFPMDDQYPLFKWSFLQSPYATLKDLNIAREALMSLSRSSSIKHEQDSETTSVNERLDSASGQDTIGPFEIEMEMKREQGGRPMLKDEDWKFKGSNPLISFEAAPGQSFRSPSYHCPGNDDKKSFLSSNDSSSVFLSSLPAPPVATGLQTTGSFSTQDSMRTDHFHVDPDSFADRPEVPTQPVVDTNTAEPNFGDDSSIDNPRGLDSSPEWVRIVRALTESDAASPAPNPRLPIWVVYAPQIPSSSTLPFLPLAADVSAHPSRDHLHHNSQSHKQNDFSNTRTSVTRTNRKARHRDRRRRRTARAAAAVINNYFRGGTHYHYNGSSTSMSSHCPDSLAFENLSSSLDSSHSSSLSLLNDRSMPSICSSVSSHESMTVLLSLNDHPQQQQKYNRRYYHQRFSSSHSSSEGSFESTFSNDLLNSDYKSKKVVKEGNNRVKSTKEKKLDSALRPSPSLQSLKQTTASSTTILNDPYSLLNASLLRSPSRLSPPSSSPSFCPKQQSERPCKRPPSRSPLPHSLPINTIGSTKILRNTHRHLQATKTEGTSKRRDKGKVYQYGNPQWCVEDSLTCDDGFSTAVSSGSKSSKLATSCIDEASHIYPQQQQQQSVSRTPLKCSIVDYSSQIRIPARPPHPIHQFVFKSSLSPSSSSSSRISPQLLLSSNFSRIHSATKTHECSIAIPNLVPLEDTTRILSSPGSNANEHCTSPPHIQESILPIKRRDKCSKKKTKKRQTKNEEKRGKARDLLSPPRLENTLLRPLQRHGHRPDNHIHSYHPSDTADIETQKVKRPSKSSSLVWDRLADIHEATLILEGRRAEAAFQRASRRR